MRGSGLEMKKLMCGLDCHCKRAMCGADRGRKRAMYDGFGHPKSAM